MRNSKQRVVINGKACLADVNALVRQGSTFGSILFLLYVNDLPGDTSLFPVFLNLNTTADEVNNYSVKINKWAHQVKMNFDREPIKQAQEVTFTRKISKKGHPPLALNNNSVLCIKANSQKQLGIVLDDRLSFEEHLKMVNKTIGLLRKLNNILPGSALLTMYKDLVRPHLQ